jgi:hypothetical protein
VLLTGDVEPKPRIINVINNSTATIITVVAIVIIRALFSSKKSRQIVYRWRLALENQDQ